MNWKIITIRHLNGMGGLKYIPKGDSYYEILETEAKLAIPYSWALYPNANTLGLKKKNEQTSFY